MEQYYGSGTAALWWLGQMGLIVKAGNTTICIDYYATPDEGRQTAPPITAAHEFLDKDPETGLYPYLQYVIEANGIRIHHAGDTVRYEGMLSAIQSFGKIDIQLLPINGRDARRYRQNCIGNMTYQEAADFAGEVGTAIVIPGHWDMFADNSADPYAFADYLDAKYHDRIACRIPKVMEKMIYESH